MATSHLSLSSLLLLLLSLLPISHSQAPNTTGYTCTTSSSYPCQSYVYYRATSPDLASVADLFSLNRRMISVPSNIPSPSSPLSPRQPLLIPITCSCNSNINASAGNNASISYASINYTIQKGDTFYLVSTLKFQNLTTYQSVQIVNPSLVPEKLEIGVNVVFPIFCKCPNRNRNRNRNKTSILISYVSQPSDTFASIAKQFGSDVKSIFEVNGDRIRPFGTVFVPVSQLPKLNWKDPNISPQPSTPRPRSNYKGAVIGLEIGLGICVVLLILVSGLFVYREISRNNGIISGGNEEKLGKGFVKGMNLNFVADVSDCLDKYKVYEIEELRRGTDGFADTCLIQGSLFKGCIGDEFYAIKKMKLNACEELKILQKVNHSNLVKLEGFCIDPEGANCYLIAT